MQRKKEKIIKRNYPGKAALPLSSNSWSLYNQLLLDRSVRPISIYEYPELYVNRTNSEQVELSKDPIKDVNIYSNSSSYKLSTIAGMRLNTKYIQADDKAWCMILSQ